MKLPSISPQRPRCLSVLVQGQTTVAGYTPGELPRDGQLAAEYRIPIHIPPGPCGFRTKDDGTWRASITAGSVLVELSRLSRIAKYVGINSRGGLRG
jgi:hypothetical protein